MQAQQYIANSGYGQITVAGHPKGGNMEVPSDTQGENPILSNFRPVFFISKSAEGYSSTPIDQEQSMAPFRSCGNQEAGWAGKI